MTVEKARKLMGLASQKYTDQELTQIIGNIKRLTDACCDRMIKDISENGVQNIKSKIASLS